jgi:hypothetical protein
MRMGRISQRMSAFAGAAVMSAMLLLSSNGYSQGHGGKKEHPRKNYRVVVVPPDTTVVTGDAVAFSAFLVDPDGARKDTVFSWSLAGRDIGSISDGGVFAAARQGTAVVVATAGRLSGTAGVRVVDPDWKNGYRVRILPPDTVLNVGQTLHMDAFLVNKNGMRKDTSFVWDVSNDRIGSIGREDGIFTAKRPGHETVAARSGSLFGRAQIHVRLDSAGWEARKAGLRVIVTPADTVTLVGGRIQFSAALVDSQGAAIDTSFTWSLEPGYLGTLSETGLFDADSMGHGFVYATAGSLSGKAHVTVLRDNAQYDSLGEDHTRWKNRIRLVIDPKDTLLLTGRTVQYRAFLVDTSGMKTETSVRWDVLGRRVGTIDAAGLFTAGQKGIGLIRAKKERYTAMARILVAASAADTVRSDSAHVRFKDRHGNSIGNAHRLGEKDVLKISGLPFPLNILNGGELTFQPGTLNGDIDIDVTLPNSAAVDTSVEFPEGILSGASFQVFVNGVPVHPFVFDSPVQITLPFKHGLFEKLGLAPEDLGVYFFDSGSLDSTGTSNVVVDTSAGLIYAEVAHFSDIVVARKPSHATGTASEAAGVPRVSMLYCNYPNPFNPDTEIRFDLAGAGTRTIRLTVYNIMGQEIRELVHGTFASGSHRVRWDGQDNAGHSVGTGIYIYRLEGPGFVYSRRMVLVR